MFLKFSNYLNKYGIILFKWNKMLENSVINWEHIYYGTITCIFFILKAENDMSIEQLLARYKVPLPNNEDQTDEAEESSE